MKRCSSVGDCRTGYMCAAVTGAGGATVCWIDCRQNPTWCSSGGFLCGSDGFCKSKLLFTSSYQKLPDTGAATVEFRCVGTVGQAGRRCELSTGDPVDLRINGSQYKLYGGCVGSSNQCQTMVVGTSFKESSSSAPGRLFCEAMGYPPASTLMATMTVAVRPTAVVQTNPFAYGTSNSKVDAYRFVECAP